MLLYIVSLSSQPDGVLSIGEIVSSYASMRAAVLHTDQCVNNKNNSPAWVGGGSCHWSGYSSPIGSQIRLRLAHELWNQVPAESEDEKAENAVFSNSGDQDAEVTTDNDADSKIKSRRRQYYQKFQRRYFFKYW